MSNRELNVYSFALRVTISMEHKWYPYTLISFNITRETKLATILNIDNTKRAGKVIDVEQVRLNPSEVQGLKNFNIEGFCKNAIYADANCMYAAQVFNLPSFDGIDKYMQEHHPELCVIA